MDGIGEPLDVAAAAAHYAAMPKEFGFSSRCKMTLLGNLAGKRVLDIDCRRGKGVIKFSDAVGPKGWAAGVDPHEEWIAVAESFKEDAWRRNGLPQCNMEYRAGFGEDLQAAGFGPESFDVAYINASLWLDFEPRRVIQQIFTVLKPGGLFMFDGVVADGAQDGATIEAARQLGNAIQAAWTREAFERAVRAAGFLRPEYYEEEPVSPDLGVEPGVVAAMAQSPAGAAFTKTTARISKRF